MQIDLAILRKMRCWGRALRVPAASEIWPQIHANLGCPRPLPLSLARITPTTAYIRQSVIALSVNGFLKTEDVASILNFWLNCGLIVDWWIETRDISCQKVVIIK